MPLLGSAATSAHRAGLVAGQNEVLDDDCRRPVCDDDVMDPARTQAAADALGNVRAEHLEPSAAVQALLDRWARGELTTGQLTAARRFIAAGKDAETLAAPTTGG